MVDRVGRNAKHGCDLFRQLRGERLEPLVSGQGEQFGTEVEGAIAQGPGKVDEPCGRLQCGLAR